MGGPDARESGVLRATVRCPHPEPPDAHRGDGWLGYVAHSVAPPGRRSSSAGWKGRVDSDATTRQEGRKRTGDQPDECPEAGAGKHHGAGVSPRGGAGVSTTEIEVAGGEPVACEAPPQRLPAATPIHRG